MLNPLIYYILSAGGISTLFYFLFKIVVSKSFDFAIEKYKIELNKELESHKQKLLIDIEKFKSGLNLVSIEHNISFGKLQQERAEVIKNTYVRLIDLQRKLINLTTMGQGPNWHNDKERDNAAQISLDDFRDYVTVNRIFLTKDVCEKILKIIQQSGDVIVDMSFAKDEAKSNIEIGSKSPLQQWRELYKKVTIEIDKTALELEDNFRILLGDK